MMRNCAISVVMPCFNVQDYIEETLKSLFRQTFQDFELICIDDGSTDHTLSVLEKYAEKHSNMKVVPETNHRQGYERNQGIGMSKGKYIYYMDSDDLLAENGLQIIFEQCEKDDLDLLFFEGDSFYESEGLEEKFPEFKSLYHRKEVYPEVYRGEELYVKFRRNGDMIIQPCLQLVRREFLMREGILFPELPLLEDNLYLFRCLLAAERVGCIKDRLYLRRVRNSSTMTAAQQEERRYSLGVTLCEIVSRAADYRENEEVYETMMEHARATIRHISNAGEGQSQKVWGRVALESESISLEEQFSLWLFLDKKFLQSMAQYRKVRDEKAELNRKLQITYDEKAERGCEIRRLRTQVGDMEMQAKGLYGQIKDLKQQIKDLRRQSEELRQKNNGLLAELKELNSRFLVRISQKLRRIIKRK